MSSANGFLRRHWQGVRLLLWLAIAGSVAVACLLHPTVAEQVLSSDGQLSPASKRMLVVVQVVLIVLAGGLLIGARQLRRHTPSNERVVLGVLFCGIAIVGSIALCELGLWAVSGVRPMAADRHFFFRHDDLLGWRHRPGAVALFKNTVVRINADGLRDDDLPYRRKAGESRLMILGDSQVFGDGVLSEDTFTQKLEQQMGGLQAINAAVIGYGTDQQFLYFQEHGRKYELDSVLVGLNAYDLTDNVSTRIRSGYVKPRFDLVQGRLQLLNVPISKGSIVDRAQRQLRTRSHLYTLVDQTLGRRRSSGREERAPLSSQVFPPDPVLGESLALTGALLSELAQSTRAAGVQLAVVFLPYRMDFSGDERYTARVDGLLSMLSAVGRQNGFPVFDLRPHLRADSEIFLDAVHFNPRGHDRVAAVLKTLLEQHGLVPARHGN